MNTTSTKPSIAFLHDAFPCGGVERITMDLADFFTSKGIAVFVITAWYKPKLWPVGRTRHYEIITLPHMDLGHSMEDRTYIINLIREYKIDFLVCSRYIEFMPEILNTTGCRLIYTNHGTPFWEVLTYRHSKKVNSKGFIRKLKWWFFYGPRCKWGNAFKHKFNRRYIRNLTWADAYVVLCEAYKEAIVSQLKLHNHPLEKKFAVIPNPEIAPGDVQLRKEKVLLYVGRMTYADKRVDRLIEIWRRIYKEVPDWQLLLVGGGEEKKKLEQQAEGLERICFKGVSDNVKPYYDRAAVLCLTSAFESWGLCLTEAQANGVIPVAFDCSAGVHQILAPSGVNGVLVPQGDMDAYAAALIDLLHNEKQRILMQRNVLQKAKEYSLEHIGQLWLNLLDKLSAINP